MDFYVLRRNSRGDVVEGLVIEAKDKENLMPADIDQVLHYSKICGTNNGITYVANDTDVSPSVQDYADEIGVQIIRTRWRA